AVEALRAIKPGAAALECDVGDEGAVEAAMDAVAERFGPVTSVFANAGAPPGRVRFSETEYADWRTTLHTNLDGAFFTLRAAVRHMLAGGGGSLVATSSLSARLGMPRGEAYSASKGAVLALVQSIAVEHGKHGIRANALMTDWIETPMTGGLLGTDRKSTRLNSSHAQN